MTVARGALSQLAPPGIPQQLAIPLSVAAVQAQPLISPKFDVIEVAHEIKDIDLETNQNSTAKFVQTDEKLVYFTIDSGATAYIISEHDEWMLEPGRNHQR